MFGNIYVLLRILFTSDYEPCSAQVRPFEMGFGCDATHTRARRVGGPGKGRKIRGSIQIALVDYSVLTFALRRTPLNRIGRFAPNNMLYTSILRR